MATTSHMRTANLPNVASHDVRKSKVSTTTRMPVDRNFKFASRVDDRPMTAKAKIPVAKFSGPVVNWNN